MCPRSVSLEYELGNEALVYVLHLSSEGASVDQVSCLGLFAERSQHQKAHSCTDLNHFVKNERMQAWLTGLC